MPAPIPTGARPLRFLVVDDSEDLRDLFCCVVERAGHVACPAVDGLDAVEILQRESFDTMLLDMNMPRMSGLDVLRWLDAHPDVAPATRVVVISAGDHEYSTHLAELGVTTVLRKPFPLQRLKDLIAETVHDHAQLAR